MVTSQRAIVFILFCTLFTSLGQLLWKYGVVSIDYVPLFLGFVSYGAGVVLMVLAFREGEVSVLYPLIALSYVFVSVLSPLLFADEQMNLLKWSGVAVILVSLGVLGNSLSSKSPFTKGES